MDEFIRKYVSDKYKGFNKFNKLSVLYEENDVIFNDFKKTFNIQLQIKPSFNDFKLLLLNFKPEQQIIDNYDIKFVNDNVNIIVDDSKFNEDIISTIYVYFENVLRQLIIVKVPFHNTDDMKNEYKREGIIIPCKNIAYYQSSGKSNVGKNFKSVWFPVYRISTQTRAGYLNKASHLIGQQKFKRDFKNIYTPTNETEMQTLINLFEKFDFYWQIQISASLISNDSIWDTTLKNFKDFCLSFSYDDKIGFYKDDNITQTRDPSVPNITTDDPKYVNKWLLTYDALCNKEQL